MLYKSFASDEDATEYFWRFWGLHTSTVVPARFYLDVRDRVPRVGDEYRALYYNPELMPPVSPQEAYKAAHLQYDPHQHLPLHCATRDRAEQHLHHLWCGHTSTDVCMPLRLRLHFVQVLVSAGSIGCYVYLFRVPRG